MIATLRQPARATRRGGAVACRRLAAISRTHRLQSVRRVKRLPHTSRTGAASDLTSQQSRAQLITHNVCAQFCRGFDLERVTLRICLHFVCMLFAVCALCIMTKRALCATFCTASRPRRIAHTFTEVFVWFHSLRCRAFYFSIFHFPSCDIPFHQITTLYIFFGAYFKNN